MHPMKCTAQLNDEKGKFIEKGMVSIPDEAIALDFTSEFIPLFKIGTPLSVAPIVNNRLLKSIHGEVYLSTPSFLRITNVQGSELTELKTLLESNIDLRLEILHCQSTPLPFLLKKTEKIDVNIYYLNTNVLKLFTLDPLDIGQRLLVQTEEPLSLKKLVIQIDKVLCISTTGLNYICSYVNLSTENKEAIEIYLKA